jgi:hypothetical protein
MKPVRWSGRALSETKVPDTSRLVSDGFCERRISLLGRYTSARGYAHEHPECESLCEYQSGEDDLTG